MPTCTRQQARWEGVTKAKPQGTTRHLQMSLPPIGELSQGFSIKPTRHTHLQVVTYKQE